MFMYIDVMLVRDHDMISRKTDIIDNHNHAQTINVLKIPRFAYVHIVYKITRQYRIVSLVCQRHRNKYSSH